MFPAYHFNVTVSMAKEKLLTSADACKSNRQATVQVNRQKIILTIVKSVVSIFICAILKYSLTNSNSLFPEEGRYLLP